MHGMTNLVPEQCLATGGFYRRSDGRWDDKAEFRRPELARQEYAECCPDLSPREHILRSLGRVRAEHFAMRATCLIRRMDWLEIENSVFRSRDGFGHVSNREFKNTPITRTKLLPIVAMAM
jgi:hypothetical protein